ncbi:MAG: energy-dependent translational throttle protein EttA [Polyangiaceae bacterium]|nr:energy-dependent translational throttle protein EttA [Polyangiaceae bacterium]
MAHEFVFTMRDLRKVVPPQREILKGIWLSFLPGAKIGVIGANGSGKSTLLKIMAGVEKEFFGEAAPAKGIKVGWLPQEPELDPSTDVRGNVEKAVADVRQTLTRFEQVGELLGSAEGDESERLMEEYGKLQEKIDATDAWELDRRLDIAMEALRLPAPDADVTRLSGGEKRRVALCRILLERPDLLLLDEPTNHLDAESVAWLERFLLDYPSTVVAITHDRYFLDNAAQWILELDRGEGHPFEGNYSAWLDAKQKRLAAEEKKEQARQKTIARELEWVKMNPKARQAKSKARIAAFEDLVSEQQRDKLAELEIAIPPGPRLGDLVVEAKGISKGYGDRLLIDDLSFSLPPGGIVGVIGGNGAGKTTLFRLITGAEQPDAGTLRLGETVSLAYVDQGRDALDPKRSVWEEISEKAETIEVGRQKIQSRAYVASFGFKGTDQQKRIGDLSGGERNRVHLAKTLKKGGNVLLLDEPTNDLDVDTLRALEEALLSFGGCVVVISHDRWFLDRIATHILAFEGDSKVTFFAGNYEDYEADRAKRLGAAVDPHRMKFKKLER